jgi:hypothetical protein
MNILSPADLDWFQGEQFRHDAIAHGHIVALPMGRQLAHFTLHLAKYQGRLLKALRSKDEDAIQRLVTDSFIMLLAIANALGRSPRIVGAGRPTSFSHLQSSETLMLAYVEVVAEMCKACAAFDDSDPYPSHTMLDSCLSTLLRIVIALANVNAVPLLESVPHRWNRVERRALANGKTLPIADVA